jgi:Domain of unknown function (DUF4382)
VRTKHFGFRIIGFACGVFLLASCGKDKINSGTGGAVGFGGITVRLTDAPGNYQQVNVDIQKVSIHLVPNSGKADWIDLNTKSGVYNLLKLQNGIDTSIVDTTKLPAGKITQMRLILGSNNSVMADSVIYKLTIPSGSQTGIKLIGNMAVDPNKMLNVLIDFDANKSIVLNGNGVYHMKPTVKVL